MNDWEDFNKDLARRMAQERADAERFQSKPEAGWAPPAQENPTNGVGFGLILMSPFLFLLYLGLGLTLYAGVGVAVLLGVALKLPLGVWMTLALVLFVLAWFPGLKLERSLSQIKPYRLVRGTVRLVVPVAAVVWMVASNQFSGPTMTFAILAIVPFHLLCRLFDRLYFPVWSEVTRKSAMAQQGTPDRRPMIKRLFYALVWLIPFIAIIQLLVLVTAGMLGGGRDETLEVISPLRNYLVPAAMLLWLILTLTGKLPGTGRHRRSLVNYELQLEMRDADE